MGMQLLQVPTLSAASLTAVLHRNDLKLSGGYQVA